MFRVCMFRKYILVEQVTHVSYRPDTNTVGCNTTTSPRGGEEIMKHLKIANIRIEYMLLGVNEGDSFSQMLFVYNPFKH